MKRPPSIKWRTTGSPASSPINIVTRIIATQSLAMRSPPPDATDDRPEHLPTASMLNDGAWIGDSPSSEEHTSELPSLMRISYAVFFLKNKTNKRIAITLIMRKIKYYVKLITIIAYTIYDIF